MEKNNILIIDKDKKEEINIFNEEINELEITVKDNASLIINIFKDIKDDNTNIKINLENHSKIELNHTYLNKNNYNLNIEVIYKSEKSDADINIYGVNDKGISNINVDGYIKENNINNILKEKIKVININKGKTISKPNMYIKTNKIIADHQNTISNINEEELFYLMSKGITKELAEKLIINGFITNIIKNKELNNKIKEYLNKEVTYYE